MRIINPKPSVLLLQSTQIDSCKWDQCIELSKKGGALQQKWALDAICIRWKALVYGNYLAVMPLPYYGRGLLQRIHLPPDYHALGIYAANETDARYLFDYFLHNTAKLGVRFIEYTFENQFEWPTHFQPLVRTTFVLPLNRPYKEIKKNYRRGVIHSINKFNRSGLAIQEISNSMAVFQLRNRQAQNNIHLHLNLTQQKKHQNLIAQALTRNQGKLYVVFNNDLPICTAFFVRSSNRHQFMFLINHPEAKTLGCPTAVIDRFIQDHSDCDSELDFSGSGHPGIAAFITGFGGIKTTRNHLSTNQLPLLFKLLKKHQVIHKLRYWLNRILSIDHSVNTPKVP